MASPAVFCLSLQLRPANDNNTTNQGNHPPDPNNTQQSSSMTVTQGTGNGSASNKPATSAASSNPGTTTAFIDSNGTIVRTISNANINESPTLLTAATQPAELNGNSIILLRGARTNTTHGQLILQTCDDNSVQLQNGSIISLCDNSAVDERTLGQTFGQIFQISGDNTGQQHILLQSVKRLENSGPILLYTSAVNDNQNDNAGGHILIHQTGGGSDDQGQGVVLEDDVQVVGVQEGHVDEAMKTEVDVDTPQGNCVKGSPAIAGAVMACAPLGSDGEPIKLPENLESLPKADHFPTQRHRWNTNEEIAAILISFERHTEWQSKEVKIRPKSGSMLLYSRKKVRYRRDGYCWKKRKDGKTTREDHMKLKVQGTECIYGCYVHSAILPTFHRRCYWLLQNPDIVLVHYLNVPYPDDNKLAVITPSLALWGDKKEWTKDELVSQLKPMFFSEDEPDLNNELEISTAETVEAIVSQLMEKQRVARQAALVKQLECGCPDSTCADGKTCSHPMRRITAAKNEAVGCSEQSTLPNTSVSSSTSRQLNDGSNQVSSTTGSGSMLLTTNSHPPRVYSRESRSNHHSHNSHMNSHVPNNTNQIATTSAPPLVLSLSQIQGGGGLLILNSTANTSGHSVVSHQSLTSPVSVASFVCSTNDQDRNHHSKSTSLKTNTLVLKQEAMDTNSPSSCCLQSSGSDTNVTTSICSMSVNLSQGSKMDVTNGNVPTVLFDGVTYGRRDKATIHHNSVVPMSSAPSTPSKHMDTSSDDIIDFKHNFCGDTVVLLGTDSSGSLISKSDGSSVINGGFFNETLDLSQEDIQRTLSANMPLCASEMDHRNNPNSVISNANSLVTRKPGRESEEMTSEDVTVSELNPMDFIDCSDVVVSPTHVVDDDVFVNLDAFDMLGEFPELEVLDGSTGVTGAESSPGHEEASSHVEYREGTVNITDYSPEWAYPEGGVKVLVTGPWYSTTAPYTVLFDTFPVPTTLVQSGVLRCYCPAHEAGLATLQVACEGFVISNSVIFEYKLPPKEEQTTTQEANTERPNDNLLKFTLLQRLEAMDDRLQIKQEPEGSDTVEDTTLFIQNNFEDRLVTYCQALTTREWRKGEELSTSWFSSHRGMTLLHLAASLGYSRLVCAMLHWRAENSSLLLETEVDALSQDDDGFTPLMWACAKGHMETAIMLYRWNHTALNIRNISAQNALECARINSHTELAREMEQLESRRERANMALLPSTAASSIENITSSPLPISPASSIVSIASIASTSKSHDGVFLRPGAVVSGSISRPTPSPGSASESSTSLHRNFGTSQSQQRLIKRPSVDSGIHMTSGQSSDSLSSHTRLRSNKLGFSRDIPKLSRFDRSMSLPLNSPPSTTDTSYDNSSDILNNSPYRKTDFVLCEVAGGSRSNSPLIDVEAVSDDESERHSVVGEQDVRVFTLAEQIIAAIPDRIKNESEEMMLDHSPGPPDNMAPPDSLSDVFMEPLLDQSSVSTFEQTEFNFEFSDHNYRYYDVATPCSSLSPASSSCLQSPSSFTLDSPSPPPTTADFCEFFQASGSVFEKDFSNLTLSDREQRELYEAAKIIQKAYRSYKGRKKLEEQDKERAAAILIQNYYRRYKQYAYFKQMTRAAMVIQNGYRSYCEHKRFKKSQEAAVCIQNYYRNYKEQGGRGSREGTPASGLKRTYSQRRQHQAARKIQQFMRQSKNKLQKERAEKEKQEGQSVDVRQKSPPREGSSTCIAPNSRSDSQNMDISQTSANAERSGKQ